MHLTAKLLDKIHVEVDSQDIAEAVLVKMRRLYDLPLWKTIWVEDGWVRSGHESDTNLVFGHRDGIFNTHGIATPEIKEAFRIMQHLSKVEWA